MTVKLPTLSCQQNMMVSLVNDNQELADKITMPFLQILLYID